MYWIQEWILNFVHGPPKERPEAFRMKRLTEVGEVLLALHIRNTTKSAFRDM